MYVSSATHNQQQNLQTWVSTMRRNSLRIAPVSQTQATNLTPKHQKNSFDTWLNTPTGRPLKWYKRVLKLQPQETLQDKFFDTEVLPSKSLVNDTLTLQKILTSSLEKHDCRTQKTDKIVSNWTYLILVKESSHVYGKKNNKMLLEPLERPTLGLCLMA